MVNHVATGLLIKINNYCTGNENRFIFSLLCEQLDTHGGCGGNF